MTHASSRIPEMWASAKRTYHPALMDFYVLAFMEVALVIHSISVSVTLQNLMDRGMTDRISQTTRFNSESTGPVRFHARMYTIQPLK